MATLPKRLVAGGISISVTGDGVLHVEVDPSKITAASELKPVGQVDVYDVDLVQLLHDSQAEGTRFWHRLLNWISKRRAHK